MPSSPHDDELNAQREASTYPELVSAAISTLHESLDDTLDPLAQRQLIVKAQDATTRAGLNLDYSGALDEITIPTYTWVKRQGSLHGYKQETLKTNDDEKPQENSGFQINRPSSFENKELAAQMRRRFMRNSMLALAMIALFIYIYIAMGIPAYGYLFAAGFFATFAMGPFTTTPVVSWGDPPEIENNDDRTDDDKEENDPDITLGYHPEYLTPFKLSPDVSDQAKYQFYYENEVALKEIYEGHEKINDELNWALLRESSFDSHRTPKDALEYQKTGYQQIIESAESKLRDHVQDHELYPGLKPTLDRLNATTMMNAHDAALAEWKLRHHQHLIAEPSMPVRLDKNDKESSDDE